MLTQLRAILARRIYLIRLCLIDCDLETLDVHERSIDINRTRLLDKRAAVKYSLATLDHKPLADGQQPF